MSDNKQDLLPCPFCGCEMNIYSNKDWHRIIGNHDVDCVFSDDETMMVAAYPGQREIMIKDWNRRAVLSASAGEKKNDQWLPIESAPGDMPILVGPTKRMGICVAMNHTRDGWVTETCSEWVSIYEPTNWMPLPPAPASKSNQEQSTNKEEK